MMQRVGTCSICGGDVMGFRGAWCGVTPPPPDTCSQCGARARGDVIDMVPRRRNPQQNWCDKVYVNTSNTAEQTFKHLYDEHDDNGNYKWSVGVTRTPTFCVKDLNAYQAS